MRNFERMSALLVLFCAEAVCSADVQSVSVEPYWNLLEAGYELVDLKVNPVWGVGLLSRESQFKVVLTASGDGQSVVIVDLSPLLASFDGESLRFLPIWGNPHAGFILPFVSENEQREFDDLGIVRVGTDGFAELLFRAGAGAQRGEGEWEILLASYLDPGYLHILFRVPGGLVNVYYGVAQAASAKFYAVPADNLRIATGSGESGIAVAYPIDESTLELLRFATDNSNWQFDRRSVAFDSILEFQLSEALETAPVEMLTVDEQGILSGSIAGMPVRFALPENFSPLRPVLLRTGAEIIVLGIEERNTFVAYRLAQQNGGIGSIDSLASIPLQGGNFSVFPVEFFGTGLVSSDGAWHLFQQMLDARTGVTIGFQKVSAGAAASIVRDRLMIDGTVEEDFALDGHPPSYYLESDPAALSIPGNSAYLGTFGDVELRALEDDSSFLLREASGGLHAATGFLAFASLLRFAIVGSDSIVTGGW